MVIKMFLIITMATLYLAIMPRCPWADMFVFDSKFITQDIQWMCTVCFLQMDKLCTVVSLQLLWFISKVDNGTFQKVTGGVA